jgi:NADPH:quinone reductase
VLIATEAIGVGGVDAVIRSGAIAGYGFTEGHIPGSEVAGTVTAGGRENGERFFGRPGPLNEISAGWLEEPGADHPV